MIMECRIAVSWSLMQWHTIHCSYSVRYYHHLNIFLHLNHILIIIYIYVLLWNHCFKATKYIYIYIYIYIYVYKASISLKTVDENFENKQYKCSWKKQMDIPVPWLWQFCLFNKLKVVRIIWHMESIFTTLLNIFFV